MVSGILLIKAFWIVSMSTTYPYNLVPPFLNILYIYLSSPRPNRTTSANYQAPCILCVARRYPAEAGRNRVENWVPLGSEREQREIRPG